jgi:hypothetical protein
MKYSISLLIIFMAITGFAQAQKGVKLFGYIQPVSKGIAAKERDENGNVIKNTNTKLHNYFVYLSSTSKSRIYPAEIWIKGERLGVKAETVSKTPVVLTKDDGTMNPSESTLVPKTKGKVLRLTGTTQAPFKEFAKAKTLAAENELVVVYKLAGKFYYATQKSLTELGSAVLQ